MAKKKGLSATAGALIGIAVLGAVGGLCYGGVKLAEHFKNDNAVEEEVKDETPEEGTETDAGTEATIAAAMVDEYMQSIA